MAVLEIDSLSVADSVNCVDKLETQLQNRLRSYVRYLRVFQSPTGLVLQGYARSYYAKQLAQQALMSASTLPLHANEIVVAAATV